LSFLPSYRSPQENGARRPGLGSELSRFFQFERQLLTGTVTAFQGLDDDLGVATAHRQAKQRLGFGVDYFVAVVRSRPGGERHSYDCTKVPVQGVRHFLPSEV
jgi:hypothetical protein